MNNSGPEHVDATLHVDPWGESRRQDLQVAMRAVIHGLRRPFEGVALSDGELRSDAFADGDTAARHFERALVAEWRRMGVDVRRLVQVVEDDEHVTDADGKFICTFDDEPILGAILMETMALSGLVPGGVNTPAGEVACGIIEACAELMRVLVGEAIVGALKDGATEGNVVVILQAGPQIAHRVAFEDGSVSSLLRVRGAVYDSREPVRSYLLGENAARMRNADKPLMLNWAFPLVELVYGPNRLRWKDRRSAPSYEHEKQKVAS